jgi:NAD(P)H-flavin reductase
MKNIYLPQSAKIAAIKDLSHNVKLFRLKLRQNPPLKNGLCFVPGQFALIGVWGYGEAPFGIASSPWENKYAEVIVRRVGTLTSQLHRMRAGDEITFRGPYGRGFPLEFFQGKDLIMVTGGCGIPPIASLIEYIIKNRELFNEVYLLYGAAAPQDILLKDKIKQWEKKIKVILTVDQPDKNWRGHVGMVSGLIPYIQVDPQNTAVAMCGPGPMTRALENILKPLGISDRRIFVSEERRMQCGIGKCQHCTSGEKYVCLDGPVFNFDEIDQNWD